MIIYYVGFIILVAALLALDLGVFHRRDTVISTKSALLWTSVWIVISLFFNILVYVLYEHHWLGIGTSIGLPTTGASAAIAFFTAYIVEKSLSIDNIFIIAMIFVHFKVPLKYQHRVLFWGILGAIIMRGIMIALGIAAIARFSWVTYILGAFLILTAIRMLVVKKKFVGPEKNLLMRLVTKFFAVTKEFHGYNFFVKVNNIWKATPLFLSLVVIESSDLIFAIDSIPAVLAITLDPFIVYTSNIFALLGMRSLYFALASILDRFRYVKLSLIFILIFVGIKMIIGHFIEIDSFISLGIILIILGLGIASSMLFAKS